ncbi:protein farnesyltransferase/geranylgeranyltransferase type-1 subunit alpha [Geosmithia morbida]|uniref:Protein farnesyltransferase/geranylgeranyltransferase type-1 subunit alpha n=1 Tax=Geosmithia morbida TaxID=1094350 RepID=A0A9P4YS88_9HYPO|nr:protein farnesyltransferase/geranylgeranyltransferase type-1 subunit alpha [Geosmithia morbida]KAF4120701.1 protein farnesyltransferase/geranylgeranyltransferase type-1 subunit alpha [Geosmithia morbida]
MPPKTTTTKGSSSSKAATSPSSVPPAAATVSDRSTQRYHQTNPLSQQIDQVGLTGLTPAQRKTHAHASLIIPVSQDKVPLSNKAEREFWKTVARENLPIRRLARPRGEASWGKDRSGRDLGSYTVGDFEQRSLKQARLVALDILHRRFLASTAGSGTVASALPQDRIDEERERRRTMAQLTRELYGVQTGSLAQDPTWDDVVPIPQDEAEGALAKIAYPEDYAEAVAYLRSVMAADECSARCLRLTEHVISMNPAHYTVWLYRFKIVRHLGLDVPGEMDWLNGVALANLKNYQIWHHRQLLMEHHYPTVAGDADAVRRLAKSETNFITRVLAEDTKNYHVWSYRQYLVGRLGLFSAPELAATQSMIEDDVRNNSAWSHRFYVVFSDPAHSTPGSAAAAHDPSIPDAVLDRELAYAREKIALAPQNQSPWNYLRGVLAKGARSPADEVEFAEQFVVALGDDDGAEHVKSSHALDLLADAYAKRGDKDRARLCLQRLADKWDPIREGYWNYRLRELEAAS